MAANWFTSLDSRMVKMFPSVSLTGMAHKRLQGFPGRLVQIVANNDAYWIKVQLPITAQRDLVYVAYGLEHEMRMKLVGAIRDGETTTATAVVEGRAQTDEQKVGRFTIAFDLPGPITLAIRRNKLHEDGTFEIFLLKAHVFDGEAPLPQLEEATQTPAPASEEGVPPAHSQTAEEAELLPPSEEAMQPLPSASEEGTPVALDQTAEDAAAATPAPTSTAL